MLKKTLLYLVFLVMVIGTLVACSDENDGNVTGQENNIEKEKETSDSVEDESDENEKASEETATSIINLLDEEEPVSIDSSDFEVVDFESSPSPKSYYHSLASHGALIFERDDSSLFIDYQTGKDFPLQTGMEDLQSEADRSFVSSDNHSESYLLGDAYYFTIRTYNGSDPKILEVDLLTGEIEEIIDAERISIMAKKDGILYVGDKENLYAVDLDKKEKIWEAPAHVGDFGYSVLNITENSIILSSLYGLQAFSIEDGQELFAEEDVYYDIVVDGNTFYALVEAEELSRKVLLEVVVFDDIEGKKETIIEAPTIDKPYVEYNVTLDLINDHFYIHFENGMFSYDANTYDLQWTVAAGDIEDRRETGDDFNYELYAAYGKDEIYTLTEKSSATKEGDNYFTVIDAASGEIKEHYSLGSGYAAGPYVDEETGKAFVYYMTFDDDDEKSMAYIKPIE